MIWPNIDIKVPDIGDFAEATVIELMVKPGDAIKTDQSLIIVESDKVNEDSVVLVLEVADRTSVPNSRNYSA